MTNRPNSATGRGVIRSAARVSSYPGVRLACALCLWLGAHRALAASSSAALVTTSARETRNRADVLLLGDLLGPEVAERLQARWNDEANFFRPTRPVPNARALRVQVGELVKARAWHVAIVGMSRGDEPVDEFVRHVSSILRALQEQKIAAVWCSTPGGGNRPAAVRANDALRVVARETHAEIADLYAASLLTPADWSGRAWTPAGVALGADTIAPAFRRALFSRSTPWAELPVGEKRDPAQLLADPALLASPMDLPEAKGTHAMVYRAEERGWQFNLHSFVTFHEGKFWAAWSSGRVDEDSSSQFMRFATSDDGVKWSDAQTLAADPDGESGPWRWMASGIYVDGGRLYALGSMNQGRQGEVGPWANARLVRFVWAKGAWQQDGVVAENSVVYFPPLPVEGRDFFVWRDSRAHYFTAYSPRGADQWEVARMPGPLPDYRMSETAAYVDADGIVHLIIRDQGYTRRLYHAVSYDAGSTWTVPMKTNYPDAVSKNMAGRLSNGWFYLINNPKASGADARDPLAITFSRDGWTYSHPLALRKHAPPLRYPGKAKGTRSFQYSHAFEHEGKLWVIYATNKEDIEISAFPLASFGLPAAPEK